MYMFDEPVVEEWRLLNYSDIKPIYEVSSLGKVRDIETGLVLKQSLNKHDGYYQVSMETVDGTRRTMKVHRLVMIAFTSEPEKIDDPRYVVNHVNDMDDISDTNSKGFNMFDNLEWATYSENSIHAVEHGKIPVGERSITAQVDDSMVNNICQLMEDGLSYEEIRQELELPNTTYIKSLLIRIKTGKQWKSISRHYKFNKRAELRKHTDDQIHEICKLIESGITSPSEILRITGIDEPYDKFKKLVWFIRKRKVYKDISKDYNW